jgi:hypothetical protein
MLVIRNEYRWIMDPRRASFVVHIDRRRAGNVPPNGGTLAIEVLSEVPHTVRVRTWWYTSTRIEVRLEGGETMVLASSIRTRNPLVLLFRPCAALSLEHKGEGL